MTQPVVSQERSYAQIPLGVLYHSDLNGNDIRVYGTLSHRAGTKDHTWPSVRRVASDLGVSTATVTACLARLETAKVVEITRTEGGVNHYHLPLKSGVAKTDTPPKTNLTQKSQQPSDQGKHAPPPPDEPPSEEPYQKLTHPPDEVSRNLGRGVAESREGVSKTDTEVETINNNKEVTGGLLPTVVDHEPESSSRRNLYFEAAALALDMPLRGDHERLFGMIAAKCKNGGHPPDEILRRVALHMATYNFPPTPASVNKRWDELGSKVVTATPEEKRKVIDELDRMRRRQRAETLEATRSLPA
jgi:hypothetical protein